MWAGRAAGAKVFGAVSRAPFSVKCAAFFRCPEIALSFALSGELATPSAGTRPCHYRLLRAPGPRSSQNVAKQVDPQVRARDIRGRQAGKGTRGTFRDAVLGGHWPRRRLNEH